MNDQYLDDCLEADVISLAESPRRALALERAARVGLPLNFFDAIDASLNVIPADLTEAARLAFFARYGRLQSTGELACLLSHHYLYKTLTKSPRDFFLILEDDFVPLGNVSQIANVVMTMKAANADVVILGYSKVDDEDEKAINLSNPLVDSLPVFGTSGKIGYRCLETTCGAVSFICNRRFLEVASADDDFGRLADDWDYYKERGINVTHLTPLMFREDYMSMPSSLEEGRYRLGFKKNFRLPAIFRTPWRTALGLVRWWKYKLSKLYKPIFITKKN